MLLHNYMSRNQNSRELYISPRQDSLCRLVHLGSRFFALDKSG